MLTGEPATSYVGPPRARRTALTLLATLAAAVLALYFVLLPCAAWIEAAVNQAKGGTEFDGDVARDLVLAAVTPLVFVLLLRRRRHGGGWLASFRFAAGYTSLVGFPLLVMRILATAPFF